MRVTSVSYTRLKNLGDYEHEKVGVEVEVAEGESSAEAMARAKKFVDASLAHPDMPTTVQVMQAHATIENWYEIEAKGGPDVYQGRQYEDAKGVLARAEAAAKPFEEF